MTMQRGATQTEDVPCCSSPTKVRNPLMQPPEGHERTSQSAEKNSAAAFRGGEDVCTRPTKAGDC
jgi:hypothetical protein